MEIKLKQITINLVLPLICIIAFSFYWEQIIMHTLYICY